MGKSIDAPEPPDLAAANAEGVSAQLDSLGPQKQVEAAAKLGTSVTYIDPFTEEEKTIDFSGFGDLDQARAMLPFIGESADAVAASQLASQEKYGLGFVEQRLKELQASDPIGFKMREEMGEDIRAELARGTELGEKQHAQVTQAERAAQAARGNIMGTGAAAAEAMAVGDAGYRLRQQRLANASSFLSGTTPVAQFGQISGAQQGASPFNPIAVQMGLGVDAQAGLHGQRFNLDNFQNKMAAHKANNSGSPLGAIGGMLVGGVGSALTGGLLGAAGGALGGSGGFSSGFSKGTDSYFG